MKTTVYEAADGETIDSDRLATLTSWGWKIHWNDKRTTVKVPWPEIPGPDGEKAHITTYRKV